MRNTSDRWGSSAKPVYSLVCKMAAHPYNIILAGKYGVGKSTIFRYLSQEQGKEGKAPGAIQRSVRSWDKWEHVMSVGKDEVQVTL